MHGDSKPDVEGSATLEDTELITEVARTLVESVDPDEMMVFDELAEEYFRDPDAAIAAHHRDEPVGFGLEVPILTFIALNLAKGALSALAAMAVYQLGREPGAPKISRALRRLLGLEPGAQSIRLDEGQKNELREVVVRQAEDLGLSDAEGAKLADSLLARMQ